MGDENTLAGVTKAHKHTSVSTDGGFLDANAVTGFSNSTTGGIVYFDASGQATNLPVGSTGDALQISGGGLPEYVASAGGSMTFLETFTNPSEQDFFECELSSDYVYADNEWLVCSLNATMTATASYPNQLGIGFQKATTGTTFINSGNASVGQFVMNPVYAGYLSYFLSGKASSLILPDSVTTGDGNTSLWTDAVYSSIMWFGGNTQTVGTHKFYPTYYQSYVPAGGFFCWGVATHEDTTLPTTLSALRFFATQGTGYTEETNGMGIDATCSFWKVTR